MEFRDFPASNPYEAMAASAETVRNSGDGTDLVVRYQHISRLPVIGAAATSFHTVLNEAQGDSRYLAATFALGVGSLAAGIGEDYFKRKRFSKAADALLDPQEDFSNLLHYGEATWYRTKEGGVQLKWDIGTTEQQGPLYAPNVRPDLSILTGVAAKHDAQLVVDSRLFDYVDYRKVMPDLKFMSTMDWSRSIGKPGFSDSRSPHDLVAALDARQQAQILGHFDELCRKVFGLQDVFTLLRTYRPDHPLLRWEAGVVSGKNGHLAKKRAEKILITNLERNLHDVMGEYVADADEPYVRERSRVALMGKVNTKNAQSVAWQRTDRYFAESTEGTLHALGMTGRELSDMLTHPHAYPSHKVVTACEFATLHLLKGGGIRRSTLQLPYGSVYGRNQSIQRRFTNQSFGKESYRRSFGVSERLQHGSARMLRKVGAYALALGLGYGAAHGLHAVEDTGAWQHRAAETIQNADQHLSDAVFTALRPFGHQLAKLQQSSSAATDSIPGGHSGINDLIHNFNAANIDADTASRIPLWNLQPQAGMDTQGYWISSTMNQLEAWDSDSMTKDMNFSTFLYEDYDEVVTQGSIKLLMNTGDIPDDMPAVTVSRTLDADAIDVRVDYANRSNAGNLLKLPVLDGTQLSAASVSDTAGNPVKYTPVRLKDGTYGLFFEPKALSKFNMQLNVSYVLTPAGKDDIGVHATGPVQTVDRDTVQRVIPSNSYARSSWRKHGADINFQSYDVLEQMRGYIQENFEYELDPLPASDDRPFVDQVLDAKAANCNVATALLMISAPYAGNPFVGFLNSNTSGDRQALSSQEGHAAVVDAFGKIVDASPHKGIDKDEQAYFKEDLRTPAEKNKARDDAIKRGIIGVLGLGLGSLGLLAAKETVQYQHAKRKLGKLSLEQLAASRAVLEHVLFAPDGEAISTTSRNTVPASFLDYSKKPKETIKAAKQAAPYFPLTGTQKKDLKRAFKIARWVRKADYYGGIEKPKPAAHRRAASLSTR